MNSHQKQISKGAESSSWVGLQVEDCAIQSALGEGAFSWVYLGSTEDGSKAVFKVAKPAGSVGKFSSDITQYFPTRALVQMTGSYGDARIDASDLLIKQAERLKSSPHKNLLQLENVINKGALCYYRCEYLEGKTLRHLIQAGEATPATLLNLARAMEDIARESNFGAHGDLKPDNIMVNQDGIKLIDPGYFGEVLDLDGGRGNALVTTPAYYPNLIADDIFAFGVIAWEIYVGQHPLTDDFSTAQRAADDMIAPELLTMVRAKEFTGNYFVSKLLQLRNPSEINSKISPTLGHLLLKLLRLKINEKNRLALDDGFESFAGVVLALSTIESGFY